jgi:multimeric flavodoxin WrbA
MKVLGICGSPRKGNTEQMLDWVLDSCRAGGAQVEMVLLREKNVEPCRGCNTCYGTGMPCVIHDDMEAIVSKMLEADSIVLATPNFFYNVSGLLKNFIDRTNSLCKPHLLTGKVCGIVAVGAKPISKSECVKDILEVYAKSMKLILTGSVLAQAEDPGEVTSQEDTKLACTDLGNRIIDKLRL